MKDRVKQITHREKNPFRETTHTVPSITAEKQTRPKKKLIPVAGSRTQHTAPSRPIEQVLVGAWNAVKPEHQGKAIMKAYDRYVHPKYQNEEERKRAALLRPKIEKVLGWTALGAEAALITFVAVKGYQRLRTMGELRRIKKTQGRDMQGALIGTPVAQELSHRIGDRLFQKVRLPGFFAPEYFNAGDAELLAKIGLSENVREQIQQGVLDLFAERVVKEGGNLSPMKNTLREAQLLSLMDRAAADFLAKQKGLDGALLSLKQMRSEKDPFIEMLEYVRVLKHVCTNRGLFNVGGFDGQNIEHVLK